MARRKKWEGSEKRGMVFCATIAVSTNRHGQEEMVFDLCVPLVWEGEIRPCYRPPLFPLLEWVLSLSHCCAMPRESTKPSTMEK